MQLVIALYPLWPGCDDSVGYWAEGWLSISRVDMGSIGPLLTGLYCVDIAANNHPYQRPGLSSCRYQVLIEKKKPLYLPETDKWAAAAVVISGGCTAAAGSTGFPFKHAWADRRSKLV